jgi:hypothetical protein
MAASTLETARVLEPVGVAGTLAWLREHPALRPQLGRAGGTLSTGFAALDEVLAGGVPAGAITELVSRPAAGASAGRTSIALATAGAAIHQGELVAWVDTYDSLDPRSLAASGALPGRFLWIRPRGREAHKQTLKAADLVLAAGGFGALVVDLVGVPASRIPASTWVRLSHRLTSQRAAMLVLAQQTLAGTQAHLRLACRYRRSGEVEVAIVKRRGSAPGGWVKVKLGVPVD